MIKIVKSALKSGAPLRYDTDLTFEGYPFSYPLHGVKSSHLKARVYRVKEDIYVDLSFDGILLAEDTSDATPFLYHLSFVDKSIAIMEREDGEKEGYILPGNSFDLEELTLLLIHSHIPLILHKDD